VERLQAEGWTLSRSKVALGLADIVWVAVAGGVAGVLLPVIGLPIGLWLGLRWRSIGCTPGLDTVLPPVRAPLPPRRAAAGAESAVVAGGLLLLTSLLLWLYPLAAVAPVLCLLVLLWVSMREGGRDALELAEDARVDTALAEARLVVEGSAGTLEEALSRHGQLETIEGRWRAGQATIQEVEAAVDDVKGGIEPAPAPSERRVGATVAALRRSRGEHAGP